MLFGGLVATGYNGFQQIDFLYMLSSIKLAITIIKYIPQVILNYERKSTIGWNVYNVLLDFAGGLLSLVQLVMDAVAMDNFSAITGNFVKFGLGFVSILFDIIFIIQHYVLYPNARYTAHREVVNSSEEVI
jgi:cystinosin